MSRFFDDVAIGEEHRLGSHTFTAEEIVAFAAAYDPQPFHVDPEAAKTSLFGSLCASGWHTASIWMRLMVTFEQRRTAAMVARGEPLARSGPSPGFKAMRWLKPVFPGDTITYAETVTGKQDLKSRPDWGLVLFTCTGHDQNGTLVFRFEGSVLYDRRTPAATVPPLERRRKP